jgi:hypothetical protein
MRLSLVVRKEINVEKYSPKGAVKAYCTQCRGMNQFNTEVVRACQGDQAYSQGKFILHRK